jgi:hypothetical protein
MLEVAMSTRSSAVKLHRTGLAHAEQLIRAGQFVRDERDDWSGHQPSTQDENRFIEAHSYAEYGKWHLGVDVSAGEDTKGRYKFPYGDFAKVHRCGLLAAEGRAGQRKYADIEAAAAQLLRSIDKDA